MELFSSNLKNQTPSNWNGRFASLVSVVALFGILSGCGKSDGNGKDGGRNNFNKNPTPNSRDTVAGGVVKPISIETLVSQVAPDFKDVGGDGGGEGMDKKLELIEQNFNETSHFRNPDAWSGMPPYPKIPANEVIEVGATCQVLDNNIQFLFNGFPYFNAYYIQQIGKSLDREDVTALDVKADYAGGAAVATMKDGSEKNTIQIGTNGPLILVTLEEIKFDKGVAAKENRCVFLINEETFSLNKRCSYWTKDKDVRIDTVQTDNFKDGSFSNEFHMNVQETNRAYGFVTKSNQVGPLTITHSIDNTSTEAALRNSPPSMVEFYKFKKVDLVLEYTKRHEVKDGQSCAIGKVNLYE